MPQEKMPLRPSDDHEPTRQKVKQTTFLNCAPGHAAPRGQEPVAGEGEEIAIVTVESGGDIVPLMFTRKDAGRLAIHLLAVVAHFGDERATEIYRRYFADCQP